MNIHDQNKQHVAALRNALYDLEPQNLKQVLRETLVPDAKISFCFPFENIKGPDELYERVYAPLINAIPDMERRDFIFMAGPR